MLSGNIKTASITVAPALDLYRKKLKTGSIVSLIAGAVGLTVYIILSAVLDFWYEETPLWADAFLIFAVPFAIGLIGYITIVRLHSREKKENRTSELIFYADCFFYRYKTAFQPDEKSEKFSYSDAVLKCENDNYGYVFVSGKGAFLVFGKEGLGDTELNAIRKLLKVAVPEGAVAELKNYNSSEENNI